MSLARLLVAGIGNIFLGDDAFGVEVAQRMAKRQLPPGLRVADFGIRGIDLSFALLENYDRVVLVDAVQRGGKPGTLYLIKPNLNGESADHGEMERGGESGGCLVTSISGRDGTVKASEITNPFQQAKGSGSIETHEMTPAKVIVAAQAMGAKLADLVILGCEPESFGSEDEPQMGLTPAVAAAVDPAIAWIETLIVEKWENAAHA